MYGAMARICKVKGAIMVLVLDEPSVPSDGNRIIPTIDKVSRPFGVLRFRNPISLWARQELKYAYFEIVVRFVQRFCNLRNTEISKRILRNGKSSRTSLTMLTDLNTTGGLLSICSRWLPNIARYVT